MLGDECEFMKTDVMSVEAVKKNCEDILARYGRVDTLLNAAGCSMADAVRMITENPARVMGISERVEIKPCRGGHRPYKA